MTDNTPLLTKEQLHEVEETARAQNRQPAEVVADAVRKYLEELSWVQFVERNEKKAHANGIGEEDVDRLISEVRHENAERGR